jgi:hypothetical protein
MNAIAYNCFMSTSDILTLLESERDRLTRAIEVLKGGKTTKTVKGTARTNGAHLRRIVSAAERKAQSERMKRYWAARRRKGVATK